ncbi:MAG TPA: DUF2911 domain-containing protein, partial [Candidatus Acidoferrales bacterium]|nr:DUF2911 domain-containing protein [Candidatus Acidoferrales bacterium]
MNVARPMLTLGLLLAAGPAAAQESGNFLIRLGNDTTSVEHYSRTATQLVIDQTGRVPNVLRRHYEFTYDGRGAFQHLVVMVTLPSAKPGDAPLQRLEMSPLGDSLALESHRGSAVQKFHIGVPPGTVIAPAGSPWSVYERETMKFSHAKADSLREPLYVIGYPGVGWMRLRRLGRDSVEFIDDHEDVFHVAVDRDGHVTGSLPVAGTQKFSVQRLPSLDVSAWAATFAAREQAEGAMGQLSTRDTLKVNAGGAALWIDYGRPAKRGREIFGNVVPYGVVWRTGANAATQFKTDRALQFGTTTVPAGFYTLWTIPSPGGWKLVVNSETGEWGTEHKPEKDLYTIPMTTSVLPQ